MSELLRRLCHLAETFVVLGSRVEAFGLRFRVEVWGDLLCGDG